jgi:hypothetical protein
MRGNSHFARKGIILYIYLFPAGASLFVEDFCLTFSVWQSNLPPFYSNSFILYNMQAVGMLPVLILC